MKNESMTDKRSNLTVEVVDLVTNRVFSGGINTTTDNFTKRHSVSAVILGLPLSRTKSKSLHKSEYI